uniref:Putative LOV domain-containing protein n=1 Tax=Scytosiphon dotyi TaxID=180438 RepID=A0A126X2N5_9PHAE|nr:putative LOV domain-containing protein [Scytosiphon dotyi]
MKLETLDAGERDQAATKVYKEFVAAQGAGIGQQERTKGTQQLWDFANSSQGETLEPGVAMQKVQEEAETTLGMLAFDAFPRFLKSKYSKAVMEDLKTGSNPNEVAALEGAINTSESKQPGDADEWLNMFVSTAESFPACIVISDMTIPGAPMVYINGEFTKTTGYTKEEAVGRNCRFLQGPETEPESIAVIRNTLSKGQDCHVKLTNYRKNGEKFQNLLSMKPVFDGDNIYRYVIGVQFEILEDKGLKKRLVQLDKLLRLLPSRLNLKSKASAQARGALAAKTTGEANTMIAAKEQILSAGEQREEKEAAGSGARPKQKFKKKKKAAGGVAQADNYDGTIFAFTKIMWLQDAVNTLRSMLMDQAGFMSFDAFLKQCGSQLSQTHLRFWVEAQQILMCQGPQQVQAARQLHMRMWKNSLFYCTTNEIVIGNLNRTGWPPLIQEMGRWQEMSLYFLAFDCFTRYMESPQSREFVTALQLREANGEQLPVKTVSVGLDPDSPSYWMDMLKAMSETLRIGLVVSDMFVPGCPLAYLNEGFAAQTGYGKENIGRNSKFLQGPMTEGYMVEEIVESLRHADPLFCKLQNHKPDGTVYQQCLCLTPVFNVDGEYKYQIGCQVDYDPNNPETPMFIMELERVVRNLPQTLTGETPKAMPTRTQELEDFLASITAGGTGAGPGGLTATPPSGSAPSGGGHPRPGASWTPA